MNFRIAAIALVSGMAATAALAQPGTGATINDGQSSFTIGDSPTSASAAAPSAFLRIDGPASATQLSNSWWFFRVDGVDMREQTVANAVLPPVNVSADRFRLNYNYGTFRVTLEWQISYSAATNVTRLVQTMTVLNVSGDTLDFNAFNYNRINVGGNTGNDTANATGSNTILFQDAAFPGLNLTYQATEDFRVTTAAAPGGTLDLLTNNAINNLSPGGGVLSAGPGDLDVASQWATELQPFAPVTFSATITIIPTPGAAALLGLGGLLAARRRRA